MPIEIVNKFYIGGLQQFDQHTQLNSIEISINNSEIIDTLARYRQHKYCFIIMPLSFSSSNTDDTYAILIPCSSLNSPKKALINGETYETLEVINLSEVRNLENIKSDSKWVDTVFDKDIQKPDHFAFGFITDSIWDILNFSFCW